MVGGGWAGRFSFLARLSVIDQVAHELLQRKRQRCEAGPSFGYLRYHIVARWQLDVPIEVPPEESLHDPTAHLALQATYGTAYVAGGDMTINELLRHMGDERPTCCVVFPARTATWLLGLAVPSLFRSIRLGKRSNLKEVLQGQPPASVISRWRRDSWKEHKHLCRRRRTRRRASRDDASYNDLLLALPESRARITPTEPNPAKHLGVRHTVLDPVMMIRGIGFAHTLRSIRGFSAALSLAHEFDNPDAEARTDEDPVGGLVCKYACLYPRAQVGI